VFAAATLAASALSQPLITRAVSGIAHGALKGPPYLTVRDWCDAVRLTKSTGALMPTMPLIDAGLTMDPSVSVPTASAHDSPMPRLRTGTRPGRGAVNGRRDARAAARPLQPLMEWCGTELAPFAQIGFTQITRPRCAGVRSGGILGAYSLPTPRSRRGHHVIGGLDIVLMRMGTRARDRVNLPGGAPYRVARNLQRRGLVSDDGL